MKSSKQRRTEIKAQRLARAERLHAQLQGVDARRLPDARTLRLQGAEPADVAALARHNTAWEGALPAFYLDRPFRCRDCAAEQVWTAKQQKWWYEAIGARLESQATRCLPCRRAHRARREKAAAGAGASLLAEEVAWLRAAAQRAPDAQTVLRVEAALASKWDGVRKVAIEVLGAWQRPQDAGRLREWAMEASRFSPVRRAAAEALAPLLRHPQDDDWVLEALAAARGVTWPWAGFARALDPQRIEAFVRQEVQRGDVRRLENLCVMWMNARRLPAAPVWRLLREHPEPRVAAMARHAEHVAGPSAG